MAYVSVFLHGEAIRASVHRYTNESPVEGDGFMVLAVDGDDITFHNVTPSILGQLANRLLGLAEQLKDGAETPADEVPEVQPATGHDATPDDNRRGCQHVNHGEPPCGACYRAAVVNLSHPLATDRERQAAQDTIGAYCDAASAAEDEQQKAARQVVADYDAAAMNDIHSTRDTSNTELD